MFISLQVGDNKIGELHDECIEVPRPGEPSAAYGVGSKKMSEAYAYIMPQQEHVNFGFYHGVALRDPNNLLEGTGKALRHVKIRSISDAKQPEIRQLILKSIEELRLALGL